MCLAKKKTKVVKRNLDPTYQQGLLFDESPQGKVLQVSGSRCLWFWLNTLEYNEVLVCSVLKQ